MDVVQVERIEIELDRLDGCARRALELGAAGHHTADQVAARCTMWGNRCWVCGREYEAVDHVKPLSKGGANWPCNLRPICTKCNITKKARWPLDIRAMQRKPLERKLPK